MPEIMIRSISHSDGVALRGEVLRPDGQKLASGVIQYDDIASIHLGAFEDGKLAAVVSFTPYDQDGGRNLKVYQLRGAATRPEVRGRGVGSTMIATGVEMCREKNANLVWCNGRSAARSFYERLGFQTSGSEFETSTGLHFRFKQEL